MPKPIKVVFVAYYPVTLLKNIIKINGNNISHTASWVVTLAEALSKNADVELYIVSESDNINFDQNSFINGIHFSFVKSPKTLNLATLYYFNKRRLIKIIKSLNPDIVHAHGCEGSIGMAGVESGYPCLLSIQGILTAYACWEKHWFGHTPFRMGLQAKLERKIIQKARYIGTRTHFDTDFIKSLNPTGTIFHAPEAMNEIYFKVEPDLKSQNIVFVGSLNNRKDPLTLLRSLKIVRTSNPACRLTLIGSSDKGYSEFLKREIKKLGIEDAVEILGFQPPAVIAQIFERSALLVLSSIMENSPNSVCEAMCAGLPVVATDVGGTSSLVQNEVTGFLVKPRNETAMAAAIDRILRDPDVRLTMSQQARAKAESRFYPTTVAQKMINIYRQIIKREIERKVG
jgi:glycosyltransferase involved in cell wall biosynthesis